MKKLITILSSITFAMLTLNSCETSDTVSPNGGSGASGSTASAPYIISSGTGGSLARFTVVGNIMYFVDNNELKIMDVKNTDDPQLLGAVKVDNETIETIFNYGSHLYLGSADGMYIYDISTPTSPEFLSVSTHATGCDPVVSDGNYAYVTVRNSTQCNRWVSTNILEIFDVSDPVNPKRVSTKTMENPIGLAIDGDLLMVCDNGIKLMNVSDRRSPILLNKIESEAFDIIIDGTNVLAVTPTGIDQYIYDRANRTLTFRSRISTEE